MSLFPIFLIGLLGSVHCIGMCGGLVSAFTVASAPRRTIPIAAAQVATPALAWEGAARLLSYNAGRIASYMAAGAVAGGMSGSVRLLSGWPSLQLIGYVLANLMLVLLGLYLMHATFALAPVEALGQKLWRRIVPLGRRLLPIDSPLKAFGFGSLWGWVPCGMVYSVLLTAMLAGSASGGASVMLAFGLGTLPMLLILGVLGARVRQWLQRPGVRLACGLTVLAFGVLGLLRAAGSTAPGWLNAFCISPAAAGVHP